MGASDLCVGDVLLYKDFEGVEGLKDRYFIVVAITDVSVECFTTTTQRHFEAKPWLRSEFVEVPYGTTCLPKHCFVDLRTVYPEDDIVMANRCRTGRVTIRGRAPVSLLRQLGEAIAVCRTIDDSEKRRLRASIDSSLE